VLRLVDHPRKLNFKLRGYSSPAALARRRGAEGPRRRQRNARKNPASNEPPHAQQAARPARPRRRARGFLSCLLGFGVAAGVLCCGLWRCRLGFRRLASTDEDGGALGAGATGSVDRTRWVRSDGMAGWRWALTHGAFTAGALSS
jgi:hypothetical protein